MLEYVLTATLLWSDAQGQIKSERINGVYASQQDCLEELTDSIAVIRRVFGAVATPTGTMCEPRKKAMPKLLSAEQVERKRLAIEANQIEVEAFAYTSGMRKAEALAAGDLDQAAAEDNALARFKELTARRLEQTIDYIERNPRPASTGNAQPRRQEHNSKARAEVEAAAKEAARAVSNTSSAKGAPGSQGQHSTKASRSTAEPAVAK